MKITEIGERTPQIVEKLLSIWEKSVRATHSFLTDEEILKIKNFVPSAIEGVPRLSVAEDETGIPVAFMGIGGKKLEMLFVSGENRGKGCGKALLRFGIEFCSVRELAVNEQNPQAIGFYEHMGFRTYKRTDHDEQGNPFPLLYMNLI